MQWHRSVLRTINSTNKHICTGCRLTGKRQDMLLKIKDYEAPVPLDLDELLDDYTQSFTTALAKHAPQKTRLSSVRPCAAWYTDKIADAKKRRRRADRRLRRTKDPDDRFAYVKACKSVNSLIYYAKSSHYTTVVSENKGNQKALFTTVNKLLHQNSGKVLPSSTSDINLAEQFADFFTNNVSVIHEGLTESRVNLHCNPSSAKAPYVSFVIFII